MSREYSRAPTHVFKLNRLLRPFFSTTSSLQSIDLEKPSTNPDVPITYSQESTQHVRTLQALRLPTIPLTRTMATSQLYIGHPPTADYQDLPLCLPSGAVLSSWSVGIQALGFQRRVSLAALIEGGLGNGVENSGGASGTGESEAWRIGPQKKQDD